MTSARPDTWMPVFWGDYARDTGHLNNAQHGAYLMLIKHYWCTGEALPDDDAQLWRIACCDSVAAWKKIRPVIARFFDIGGGVWRHGRVDKELALASQRIERRRAAGKAGASSRWSQSDGERNGNANSNRMANASDSQWQNGAYPQSQVKVSSLSVTAVPNSREKRAHAATDADAVVQAFDDAIAEHWGEEQRRPWPTGTDRVNAQRMLDAGATVDLCREVFRAQCGKLLRKNRRPPKGLGMFADDVANAITAVDRPLARGERGGGRNVVPPDRLFVQRVSAALLRENRRPEADALMAKVRAGDDAGALTDARALAERYRIAA